MERKLNRKEIVISSDVSRQIVQEAALVICPYKKVVLGGAFPLFGKKKFLIFVIVLMISVSFEFIVCDAATIKLFFWQS